MGKNASCAGSSRKVTAQASARSDPTLAPTNQRLQRLACPAFTCKASKRRYLIFKYSWYHLDCPTVQTINASCRESSHSSSEAAPPHHQADSNLSRHTTLRTAMTSEESRQAISSKQTTSTILFFTMNADFTTMHRISSALPTSLVQVKNSCGQYTRQRAKSWSLGFPHLRK